MTQIGNWPRVAVIGAGAVGCYFGGLLARAGAPVTMIGRKPFVEAVSHDGLLLETLQFRERVHVDVSIEISAARGADLVLFCVKTTDNGDAARELAPFLAPGAIVLSLQNGVDNVQQIRAAAHIDALPVVVYVAASVVAPGHVKHSGRGDLVVGPGNEHTRRVADIFTRAGIPCRIAENVEGELWTKLLWNCALNAISALGRANYGRIAESSDARRVVEAAVFEILTVARAAGVVIPGFEDPEAAVAGALKLAGQMAGALSSTAQDIIRGKRTEIDSLNGYVCRRGAELGVATPVNQTLFSLVKLLEQKSE